MLFHSTEFIIFLVILFALLFIFRNNERQKVILLLGSCIFYMWWNPAFIGLIFASIIVDYFIGNKLYYTENKRSRKVLLLASIGFNLGMLAFFKYVNFFSDNLLWFFQSFGYEPSWTTLNILLPVGISFYTFQTMSYTIDIYRKELKPVDSFLDFAVFVSFFPQLVAGPIIRAKDFLPQLNLPREISFKKQPLFLVIKGLFKKVIIADNLGLFADAIYTNPYDYPSIIIWIATLCFAIQIYCDFSGYTDIAIGIAAILGFHFPLNFNRPYFAITPSDFWRRWHISLSSWLRDYLYIPLGGNRGGELLVYRNLMLTMLLGGLWHGASWNFVLWGFLHGLILIVYRVFKIDQYLKNNPNFIRTGFSWLLVQLFVLVTWITFRQVEFDKMVFTLKKFLFFDFNFSIQSIGLGKLGIFSTIIILMTFYSYHFLSFMTSGFEERLSKASGFRLYASLFFIGVIFFFFWPTKEVPFIYFQF